MEQTLVQTYAIPSGKATKRLKLKTTGGRKKVSISSNLLCLFGFEPGDRVIEESLGDGQGIRIERVTDLFTPIKTKKVYSRTYKHRRNSPLEAIVEVSSQRLINKAIPSGCEYVHIDISRGVILIKPIITHKARAIMNATPQSKYEVFGSCTSGVDLSMSVEPHGMHVGSVIEWRPIPEREKNRKSDLTEAGVLTILRNIGKGIKNVFCEDITTIDLTQLAEAVAKSPATTFMASPQCSDFSNVKSKSLKDKSISNLSSTLDMAYDMLRVIETIAPPVCCFEQVEGWYQSQVYELLKLRMRKWGYSEHLLVADARDYGGMTSRKRGYSVFTCLDAPFQFEPPTERNQEPIWPIIEEYLPDCREVTHSRSFARGIKTKRLRRITPQSTFCPTILRSQPRMSGDSVVIEDADGRLYWMSEDLQLRLMGLQGFKLDCCSGDVAGEILGQSIQRELHDSVMRSLKNHIDSFFMSRAASIA